MSMRRRVVQLVAAAGAVSLLAACGLDNSQHAAPTSTVAAMPTGYDPCTQLSQSVIQQFGLHGMITAKNASGDGIRWQGCDWVRSDWYAISIRVSNASIADVLKRGYTDVHETTIDGRRAVSSRQVSEHAEFQCSNDVEITGGTLEFFLSNSASDRMGGSKNPCDMVREISEAVVPTLPAGV